MAKGGEVLGSRGGDLAASPTPPHPSNPPPPNKRRSSRPLFNLYEAQEVCGVLREAWPAVAAARARLARRRQRRLHHAPAQEERLRRMAVRKGHRRRRGCRCRRHSGNHTVALGRGLGGGGGLGRPAAAAAAAVFVLGDGCEVAARRRLLGARAGPAVRCCSGPGPHAAPVPLYAQLPRLEDALARLVGLVAKLLHSPCEGRGRPNAVDVSRVRDAEHVDAPPQVARIVKALADLPRVVHSFLRRAEIREADDDEFKQVLVKFGK